MSHVAVKVDSQDIDVLLGTSNDRARLKNAVWLGVANIVSSLSTCPRLAVGAVIVGPGGKVMSTGYNGSPAGQPHCLDAGCLLDGDGSCIRAIHAEENAIRHAYTGMAYLSKPLLGCVLYSTASPCYRCANLILQVGVGRVVCRKEYRRVEGLPNPIEFLRAADVTVDVVEFL